MLYDSAELVRVYVHAWQLTDDPFSNMLSAAGFALGNVKQVAAAYDAVAGPSQDMLRFIQHAYPPLNEAPPLLMKRPLKDNKTTMYVREGFVCKIPGTSLPELEKRI